MMKNSAWVMALVAGVACAAGAKERWEDPAVNSVNRLPARTYAMPLGEASAALTDALEPETPYAISLNGDWKIKWVGDPARRPQGFEAVHYDDSDWNVIDVPSCVEMRGFGTPGYTNVRYPHKDASQPSDPNFAKILDRDTGRGDYNPVSSYRTTFTVPALWADRDVILRFDGVYSAYTVWVNGREVGYAEDSKLPSEFDVTSFLTTDGSPNTLAVQVFRWCDGSYLEDQDMFRFSGIFRDVTLWAKPKGGIWDFNAKTTLARDFSRATLTLEGIDGAWSATLYDPAKKVVGTLKDDAATLTVEKPVVWSAEMPALYTLVIQKGADIRMKRIGFKDQRVVGNTVLVNFKPIKFKGVNRHETNPENGRSVTLEDMLADIFLMKRYNIDTVRTSHYPNDRRWYDLCDRYGLYLVAEANVEGHEPGYSERGLGRIPAWEHTIVERNERHAVFYRNNASVTLWSLGNETGHGDNFRKARDAVKAADPTRPVHWERGNKDADLDSTMYPSVEWLVRRGQLGGEKSDATLEGESDGDGFAASSNSAGRPLFMCEYAHAMGNAIGNLKEYWDAIYTYPALCGGCIWDWVDQALWKTTDRYDNKTRRQERYLGYGGDWDEVPNDGPFCDNGVVDPLRQVNAKLIEVGHVYQNLIVTGKDGAFELENRFLFTSADQFDGAWALIEDGEEVASGAFAVPAIGPLARGALTLDGLTDALKERDRTKEHFVNVAFTSRAETPWAPKGWTVARDQVALPREAKEAAEGDEAGKSVPQIVVEETADDLTVECARTTAVFDRASGTLRQLVIRGVNVIDNPAPGIVGGPRLTCLRAMTDNDRWMWQGAVWHEDRTRSYLASGLTQLSYHPGKLRVTDNVVTVTVDVAGAKGCGFTHETAYQFEADGSVRLTSRVTPYGAMPVAIPRLGLTLHLPPRLEQMRYYGRGPEENYVDRNSASFVGVYRSTVTDQYVDYVRPQDCGAKSDVRWVEFTDKYGKGVRFSASEPLFIQALHYGWEDLEFARHVNGQRRFRRVPEPREDILVNLDVRQTGLGGASCGPVPMDKYRFNPSAPVEWTLTIEGARK